MDTSLLLENISNPALLFFFLGLIAVRLKSDLEIPGTSSKFISLYLLLAIGFKGGQELSHADINAEIIWSLLFGLFAAIIVPFYTFFLLKRKYSIQNAGAIAATYGSVSAVTFVTTVSFLELQGLEYGGHMVAVMAIMEAPAIIVGVLLMTIYNSEPKNKEAIKQPLKHAITNGSVILIMGSLVIGYLANDSQAEGIRPFTTDLFKGFLAVFLLDMGISSGRKLQDFLKKGWSSLLFAIIIPIVNGTIMAIASGLITDVEGNRLLLAILAASASYIAVPAAMKIAAPEANSSLYFPMALGITFPLNITIGMPLYLTIIQSV